jgi:ferredoxin
MNWPRRVLQAASLTALIAAVFHFGKDAERWCPFGAVESAYAWVKTGSPICAITYTNLYAFIALIVTVLLLKRSFCGYVCPLGTIGDWMGRFGRFRRNGPLLQVPRWLDCILSMGKYVTLSTILWVTWRAGDLVIREFDPCYALVTSSRSDVTLGAVGILVAIVVASRYVDIPFCRWLCPLAAVMNPISRLGLVRVHREQESCVNCGKCADVCPMDIRVDTLETVKASRCMLCQACVNACPVTGKRALLSKVAGRRRISRWAIPATLGVIVAGLALATHVWPMMTFHWQRGEKPEEVATMNLRLQGFSCSGSGLRLAWFLERDDLFFVPGYLCVEAIPSAEWAHVRIHYDPAQTDPAAVIEAITFPYVNAEDLTATDSPFMIKDYVLPPPE